MYLDKMVEDILKGFVKYRRKYDDTQEQESATDCAVIDFLERIVPEKQARYYARYVDLVSEYERQRMVTTIEWNLYNNIKVILEFRYI